MPKGMRWRRSPVPSRSPSWRVCSARGRLVRRLRGHSAPTRRLRRRAGSSTARRASAGLRPRRRTTSRRGSPHDRRPDARGQPTPTKPSPPRRRDSSTEVRQLIGTKLRARRRRHHVLEAATVSHQARHRSTRRTTVVTKHGATGASATVSDASTSHPAPHKVASVRIPRRQAPVESELERAKSWWCCSGTRRAPTTTSSTDCRSARVHHESRARHGAGTKLRRRRLDWTEDRVYAPQQVASYGSITREVQVYGTPTILVINKTARRRRSPASRTPSRSSRRSTKHASA